MILTVANILTISRLVIVPFFIAAFVMNEMGWAFALFCIAGGTDLIDGTVARKFSRPTRWGAILDPIADKCLVQSCFISLGVVGVLPWWFVVLALCRDVMIVGGIIYLRWVNASLPYRPAMVSKFATLFQLLVAVLALLSVWRPGGIFIGREISQWLLITVYVAAVFILLSGAKYVMMGLEILRQSRERHA